MKPESSENLTNPDRHDSHMSYYGGDGKLRVFNRHIGVSDRSQDQTYGERGTFDEYRYDALGRRVLTRTRRIGVGCPSTLDCQSRAIRTVWDGGQVLYEIRAPGGEIVDTLPTPPDSSEELSSAPRFLFMSEAAERNFSAIQVDTTTDPLIESDAEFVSYSYAPGVLGVDEPIEIHKGSETVIPHTGWRGMLAMGTYTDGTQSDCAVANPCTRIDWPAMNVTTDGAGYNRTEPSTWYGSIASTGTEGSGLQYMRNRYYDPKRGQFTQADPIGLAGGMNLYGFAEGDPINFGDPFGLCPPEDTDEGPQCVIHFRGISVTAIIGTGWTIAAGRYKSGEGSGWYFRVGVGTGVSVGASVEAGASKDRASFAGNSQGGCVTLGYFGACRTVNAAGSTETLSAGISPLPVGAHGEETSTVISGPVKKGTRRQTAVPSRKVPVKPTCKDASHKTC